MHCSIVILILLLSTAFCHADDQAVLEQTWRLFASAKQQAERQLLDAIAGDPGNLRLGANLGFLYAMEILGIDGFGAGAHPDIPLEQRQRTAEQARQSLRTSTNSAVLAGAGAAIPKLSMMASAGRMVDPQLFELASQLNARARTLSPGDKAFAGPMPMVQYLQEALESPAAAISRGWGPSPIITAGKAAAQKSMEESQKRWEEADRNTTRLAPSAFSELPANLVRELDRRGCTIPQTYSGLPHNVIQGEFATSGQTDWAVLCSVNRVSTILVFWNASEESPAELAPAEDIGYLQGIGEGKIGYSRAISPVSRNFILSHYQPPGGEQPPPITHHGIDDAFIEKASVVHYLHQGRWLKLMGSD